MEQLGAGSRPEGVEARSEAALEPGERGNRTPWCPSFLFLIHRCTHKER